jgi:hypothetical protein
MRLPIIAERPHAGPMKTVASAKTTQMVQPRIFSDRMGTAWLTHNVEEVSMFENLLPSL